VFPWETPGPQPEEEVQVTTSPANLGFEGKPWRRTSNLTPDGKFLYASNATTSTLDGLQLEVSRTGLLTPIDPTHEKQPPRAFNIDPTGRSAIFCPSANCTTA